MKPGSNTMPMHDNGLSREYLESVLADYATGLLSQEETGRIGSALAHHPDLKAEADDMKIVRVAMSRTAHNDAIDYAARNLSVHVVERLKKRPRRSSAFLGWIVLPAATVAAVAFFVLDRNAAVEPIAEPVVAMENMIDSSEEPYRMVLSMESPIGTAHVPQVTDAVVTTLYDEDIVDQLVRQHRDDPSATTISALTDEDVEQLLAGL